MDPINFFIGYLIGVIFVFGSLIIFLLTKKPTIKKIVLKNNVIELYNSNNEVETYEIDNIDIKYNVLGYYGRRQNKFIIGHPAYYAQAYRQRLSLSHAGLYFGRRSVSAFGG